MSGPDRNFRGVRSEITWGEEFSVEQSLENGTIASGAPRQCTGLSGLTTNKYAGQTAVVIPRGGGADAKKFHIESNTDTVITFEEDIYDAGVLGGTTPFDTIVITQRNVTPDDLSSYFGHVEETELPERKLEVFKGFYKGSSEQPFASDIVPMKASYEASIPIRVVNGKLLFLAMGKVIDDGSNASTVWEAAQDSGDLNDVVLAYATVPGQSTITVTHTPDPALTTSSYISIGTVANGDEPEIRKVASNSTTTIVLSEPLRRCHDAAEPIYLVDATAGYIKHIISITDSVPYFSIKRTLYGYRCNTFTQDYAKVYRGLKAKSLELNIAAGDAPLQATMSVSGLSIDDSETERETISSTGYTGKKPYIYNGSETSINDIVYRQAGSFSVSLDREMDTKWYHEIKPQNDSSSGSGGYTYGYLDPSEHLEGIVNSSFTTEMPLHNKNFWNLLKAMSEISDTYGSTDSTTNHQLNRGTNDILRIDCYNNVLIEGSEPLPRSGEIPTSLNFEGANFDIVVEDGIYYY